MTLHIRTRRGRQDAMVAAYKRSVAPERPNAKTQTIANLIAWHVKKHGEPPSPQWLASTCAMSLERVKKHLELLESK